ncbi:imidazole glycerol phosphate synthase subunit HisF [Mesoterricola sediminis]|uniref:Imidazole glycerol phosphate synthase subunit HisF n=1 Tax=Mesoterricola sediminis TaxID=2927980 RepID=A0AA48KEW5_9BACT|nr:imidazole glycerol phosphate synthase subunit HisF [Mesoterricola sediminis]BDU75863.1 imidazole glycerol phosphate synthase subunit HisF [Mesoterricola sediminis]
MVMKRVIPCLDVKDGRVVKGVQFQDLRDNGDPVELASRYDAEGADELVFLDITAGIEHRDTARRMVEAVARQVFIPFTVGGGIRSVADAEALLMAGCDKVAVNSAAVRRPGLLTELASRFGSQCVVLAADVRRTYGGVRIAVDAGRTLTDLVMEDWLREAQDRGAGEVLLTSMDRDGTGNGYDLEVLASAAGILRVPLIASGGFGEARHAVEALGAGADAVLAAGAFHVGGLTVRGLKQQLAEAGVEVRAC